MDNFKLHPFIYDRATNLTLVFNPKSASSIIVAWFFYQIGEYGRMREYNDFPHKYRVDIWNNRNNVSSIPFSLIKDSKVICSVRNPSTRAISGYKHAIKFGYLDDQISDFFNRVVNSDNTFSFSEYLEYLKSIDIRFCNEHMMSQWRDFLDFIPKYDVIKTENIIEEIRYIESKLKLKESPLEEIIESLKFHNKKIDESIDEPSWNILFPRNQIGFPKDSNFLCDDTINSIKKIYEKDFVKFKY